MTSGRLTGLALLFLADADFVVLMEQQGGPVRS